MYLEFVGPAGCYEARVIRWMPSGPSFDFESLQSTGIQRHDRVSVRRVVVCGCGRTSNLEYLRLPSTESRQSCLMANTEIADE